MKELNEYRTKLMDRLVSAAREFRDACLIVPDAFAPLNESGWNAHQVAAHTRDVNRLVYGLRARRTVIEENPEFPNFDGDAYMAENYNVQEPLNEILDSLVQDVEILTGMLRQLPSEAWSRESRHTTLGSGFT